MAGANLLALLDDITSMLDDVALMTKVAAKKTVGVLGDDLALNAQQVAGSSPNRELPVVLSVARGSLLNKAILIPLALLISAFAPWLITPLLMLGGAYLSFEGAEKVLERLRRRQGKNPQPAQEAGIPITSGEPGPAGPANPANLASPTNPAEEKRKIRGAVRTDFILSTEIIVIALGSLPVSLPFWERAVVLCLVGLCITVGVYGLVAAIVKIDDIGLWLLRQSRGRGQGQESPAGPGRRPIGRIGGLLVKAMPYLMRFLTVAGTLAMFMVGGGILAHGIPWLDTRLESLAGLFLPGLKTALLHLGLGLAVGLVLLGLVNLLKRIFRRDRTQAEPDSKH